ncbi:MAG: FAD-dependent oxidoreductase [Dermabacter sp.]|nr:FAD-dependent oxidoreductase [Dermabacter sp.]
MTPFLTDTPFRVAVIGSGPAGVYAAETLKRTPHAKRGDLALEIDIFDALPTPFGLIRYGVAPDHPRIKGITTALHRILDRRDMRFFGNVEFGTDLTFEDIHARYDAVIFATGALRDAELDIPGIDLEGSLGAADFVAWYDGNPDYPRTWPLDQSAVAVIGNGNVALDVARMLSKSASELLATEIPDSVAAGLEASAITDVHVFGRRGPAQAKFSPLEIRELAHPEGVQVIVDPRDLAQITDDEWAQIRADKRTDQIVSTFEGWLHDAEAREAAGEEPTDQHGGPVKRRLHMHFWHNPVEVLGTDGRVSGMRFERTALADNGGLVGTGEFVDYPLGQVYRAVGYFGSELPGVPFNAERGVIHNAGGRVTTAEGRVLPGVYANGWIKRGPVGLIGATKSDAIETVTHMIEDIEAGALTPAPDRDPDSIVRLLEERGVRFTDWDGWHRLHEAEVARGAERTDARGEARPSVKVIDREEMVRIARGE